MTGKKLNSTYNFQERISDTRSSLPEGSRGEYLPDSEEIARITAEIREGWNDEQRTSRMRFDQRPIEFDINTLHISSDLLMGSCDR